MIAITYDESKKNSIHVLTQYPKKSIQDCKNKTCKYQFKNWVLLSYVAEYQTENEFPGIEVIRTELKTNNMHALSNQESVNEQWVTWLSSNFCRLISVFPLNYPC